MNKEAESASENSPADWRVFKHDTEAGRLLSRLYGVDPSGRTQIKYPKLKKRSTTTTKNIQAKDEKKKISIVQVPRVGRKTMKNNNKVNPLNAIPRRKTAVACRDDVEKTSLAMKNYRPPHVNTFASDDEKIRLNDIFSCKGGRALPHELTQPNTELSDEAGRADKKRVNKSPYANERKEDGPPRSVMAKQIISEIEERRQFQMELEKKGIGSPMRRQITNEIESRLKELSIRDPKVAKAYMKTTLR
jgi:hypothetical protein